MSPEQVEAKSGSPKPDRRADIFSVGVMMWEAATGVRMWKGRSEPQIINLLMNGAIPRPRELAPDLILTPLLLLAGVHLPLLLDFRIHSPNWTLKKLHFAGILSVGVGDSFAAIIGSRFVFDFYQH